MMRLDRRRALSGLGVLAIAAGGAVWSGCGDDDASDQVDDALSTIKEQADEAQSTVEEAADDAQQQAEDLQNEIEDQVDEATQDAQNGG
jgi:gas vesicle protein